MTILAADRTAIGPEGVVAEINKIAVNRSASLAVAIAGLTQEHQYLPELEFATNIDAYIARIRRHMDHYLSIYDRKSLLDLSQFHKNEGIASFFDEDLKGFYSYKYLFSPVETQNRLYRASNTMTMNYVGSGAPYLEKELADDVESFKLSVEGSCSLGICASWLRDIYRKVNEIDSVIGKDPLIMVATKDEPAFRKTDGR